MSYHRIHLQQLLGCAYVTDWLPNPLHNCRTRGKESERGWRWLPQNHLASEENTDFWTISLREHTTLESTLLLLRDSSSQGICWAARHGFQTFAREDCDSRLHNQMDQRSLPVEIWCSIPSFSIHRSWEAEQGTTEDGVFEQILRSFLSLWRR